MNHNHLFLKIFKPNSSIELTLRARYHRFRSWQLVNYFHRLQAARSVSRWKQTQRDVALPGPTLNEDLPVVTFLVSAQQNDLAMLQATIASLQKLVRQNWVAYTVVDQPDEVPGDFIQGLPVSLLSPAATFQKVKENAIPGDYLVFCQAGDRFDSRLLWFFYDEYRKNPGADLYYYDRELRQKTGKPQSFFEPEAPSPELLLSINYFSRAFIRSTCVHDYLGDLDPGFDLASAEYRLILRIVDKKVKAHHIPYLLLSQAPSSPEGEAREADYLAAHLADTGRREGRVVQTPHGRRVSWETSTPSVAINILTKDNLHLLRPMIRSLIELTDYPNYKINIVDNGSTDPEALAYYSEIADGFHVQVTPYNEEFNYSRAINLGAGSTNAEMLLFLNDDMHVIDPDWLTELVRWASLPEIGVVGCKLIRRNHTIQHAGIIMGMNGFMGHLYLNAPEHYFGLLGSADWYRNVYAVTGACQMVRRNLFEAVNGYDEKYRLVFGDIDFCLRLHDAGYRNLYTPFARLYHYEGRSRGYESPVGDVLRGYTAFQEKLAKHDPYFSKNLTYTTVPQCDPGGDSVDRRLRMIEERREVMQRHSGKFDTPKKAGE